MARALNEVWNCKMKSIRGAAAPKLPHAVYLSVSRGTLQPCALDCRPSAACCTAQSALPPRTSCDVTLIKHADRRHYLTGFMSRLFGKAVDAYKSGVKATIDAGLVIARDHLVSTTRADGAKTLISKEGATDFAGHAARVNSLAISQDGETLFSAGQDEEIRMWHTRTGKIAGIVGVTNSEVRGGRDSFKSRTHYYLQDWGLFASVTCRGRSSKLS